MNDLRIGKLYVALAGVVALVLGAFVALMGVPGFRLYRRVPWMKLSTAFAVANAIFDGYAVYTLIAVFGMGIGSVIAAIGLAVLRRYVRRYGVRALAYL